MDRFFEKSVDLRSRAAMVDFLEKHDKYDSCQYFSHNIKVYNLGLTQEQTEKAYQVINSDDNPWDHLDHVIDSYQEETSFRYSMGTAGRSSGYLLMHHAERVKSEYKSFCTQCGQRNFKRVHEPRYQDQNQENLLRLVMEKPQWVPHIYLEMQEFKAVEMIDDEKIRLIKIGQSLAKEETLDCRCGRCNAEARVNRDFWRINTSSRPTSRPTYDSEEIEYASIKRLRQITKDVLQFDQYCDHFRSAFIDLIENCEVVEEEVVSTRTVKRIACACE